MVNGVATVDNVLYPYNQTFADSFFTTRGFSGRPVNIVYQDNYVIFQQTYLNYSSVSITDRALGFASYSISVPHFISYFSAAYQISLGNSLQISADGSVRGASDVV